MGDSTFGRTTQTRRKAVDAASGPPGARPKPLA